MPTACRTRQPGNDAVSLRTVPEPFSLRAVPLDRADPLASLRDEFLPATGVLAYLDGNSLGRPLRSTAARLSTSSRTPGGSG